MQKTDSGKAHSKKIVLISRTSWFILQKLFTKAHRKITLILIVNNFYPDVCSVCFRSVINGVFLLESVVFAFLMFYMVQTTINEIYKLIFWEKSEVEIKNLNGALMLKYAFICAQDEPSCILNVPKRKSKWKFLYRKRKMYNCLMR